MDIAANNGQSNVVNLPVPNIEAMRQHLEHLFGGYLDGCQNGLIELAWTDTHPGKDGKYKLRHGRMYGTDELDDLAEEAVRLNSQEYCNVYVGAALRIADVFPGARARDEDVLALTCAYVDLDDDGAIEQAVKAYGADKPTLVVMTGRNPHTRAQCWWRLEEPVTDPAEIRSLLKGLATALGGDETVVNPSRVMRLAGSIAWPQKPGRQVELTAIVPIKTPSHVAYAVPELMRRFPVPQDSFPIVDHNLPITGYDQTAQIDQTGQTGHAGHAQNAQFAQDGITREQTPLGLPGRVNDGRDVYLRNTVEAVLIQLIGETGRVPLPQELINAVWVQYSANADMTKAGKGVEAVIEKCTYTLRRFHEGRISGLRDIEQAKAIYARKRGNGGFYRQNEGFTKPAAVTLKQPESVPLYELLSVKDIKTMPDPLWLVDGLVIDQAMGFIYGPPGCLKTFLALDLALTLATGGRMWWNRGVQRNGAVVYISSEGQGDLKYRIRAWEQQNKIDADDSPFRLIRQSINFMNEGDVGKLLATVQSVAAITPVAAVFVDTVSRVLPGAEENLQKDMSLFVVACDAVRQAFNCTVFGIHHTNKGGTMRGSTVMPGAGDFIIEVRREPGALTGSIFASKIKAAEDGWEQHFKVTKVELPDIVPHTSLTLSPVEAMPKAKGTKDGLPDLIVCREILSEIAQAWERGAPWSHANNGARPATRLIMKRWHLERKVVQDLLDHWMSQRVIEHSVFSAKLKVSGYRKLVSI